MPRTTKTSQNWNKNTPLRIGIIGYSLLLILFHSVSIYATTYEVQFFTIRIHNKLNYSKLNALGIKKILFRVFEDNTESNRGLYFINSQFRTLEPALEKLISEFDFKQLQLCAWMITRNFNWIENHDLFDYQFQNGKRQRTKKLDIFNPEVKKKLVNVFKELASNKIDCILIQDDFIFRYNEGFSNWGKAKFTGVTGVPAVEKLMMKKNSAYNRKWKEIKIDQINKMLQLIIQKCKMVNSAIKIGINIYYEAPLYEKRAEEWYSHNLKRIAATGIDYIYLMSYHRQIKKEMQLKEAQNKKLFERIVKRAYQICKEKLIVKLQIRDWDTSKRIPADEVRSYLNLIPPQVQRVCFTPTTPNDFEYLKSIIEKPIKNNDQLEN